tara:strand:+ start:209 stop:1024 length:816 start_codon:yes stop_codon:yes gene_type:complete
MAKRLTDDQEKEIKKLYLKDFNLTNLDIANKVGLSRSGLDKVISRLGLSKLIDPEIKKKRSSVVRQKFRGIDWGKKGRKKYQADLYNIRKKIFKIGEQKCSRCKLTKKLDSYRRLPKKQQKFKDIVLYVSHCNLCDAKRTAAFKSKKSSTINGHAEFLMSGVRRRTKDKKLKSDISVNWIVKKFDEQKGLCFYSKEKMTLGTERKIKRFGGGYKKNNKTVVSIDRVDPDIGYTKTNCVLCCWYVNNMKQDLKLKEFKNIIKKLNKSLSKNR